MAVVVVLDITSIIFIENSCHICFLIPSGKFLLNFHFVICMKHIEISLHVS
jgi:hypothetical protein